MDYGRWRNGYFSRAITNCWEESRLEILSKNILFKCEFVEPQVRLCFRKFDKSGVDAENRFFFSDFISDDLVLIKISSSFYFLTSYAISKFSYPAITTFCRCWLFHKVFQGIIEFGLRRVYYKNKRLTLAKVIHFLFRDQASLKLQN